MHKHLRDLVLILGDRKRSPQAVAKLDEQRTADTSTSFVAPAGTSSLHYVLERDG